MTGKTSLKIYYDYADTIFSDLEFDEIGMLLIALISYERDGAVRDFDDRTVRTAFKRMMADSDKNMRAYKETCERNRENGKKGGRPAKTDENPKEPSGLFGIPKEPSGLFENPNKPSGLLNKEPSGLKINPNKPSGFLENPKKADNEYEYDYDYEYDNDKDKEHDRDKDKVKDIGCGEKEQGKEKGKKYFCTSDNGESEFINSIMKCFPVVSDRRDLKDVICGNNIKQEDYGVILNCLQEELKAGKVSGTPDRWLMKHLPAKNVS